MGMLTESPMLALKFDFSCAPNLSAVPVTWLSPSPPVKLMVGRAAVRAMRVARPAWRTLSSPFLISGRCPKAAA